MKNLLLIISIAISFSTTALASNIGDDKLSIINNDNVELSYTDASQKAVILFSAINTNKEALELIFDKNVSMIQVFDMEGELEMMLPIASNEVDLGLSLFEPGTYKLGLMVDGLDEIQFTNMMIK